VAFEKGEEDGRQSEPEQEPEGGRARKKAKLANPFDRKLSIATDSKMSANMLYNRRDMGG
jgi:hypothetical protein